MGFRGIIQWKKSWETSMFQWMLGIRVSKPVSVLIRLSGICCKMTTSLCLHLIVSLRM